jgi:hypothetical protein
MAYLNVSPMISALQDYPETFSFESGELYHIPSRHRFLFDSQRHVRVDANCNCSSLRVSTEQEGVLYDAYQQWRTNYWRAVEINREFAMHFAPPSRFRSWLIGFTGWLHRAAITGNQRSKPKTYAAVPAE